MSQLTQFTGGGSSGGSEPKGSITTQFPYSAEALIEYNNDFYVKTGTRVMGLTPTQQSDILAATDDFMLPSSATVMAAAQASSSKVSHSFVYGNGVYIRSTSTGVMRSTDGISWMPVEIINDYSTNVANAQVNPLTKMVFGAGIFMVAIDISTTNNLAPASIVIITSADGLTWDCSTVALNITGEPYAGTQSTYLDLEFDGTNFWLGTFQTTTGGGWPYTAAKSIDGKTWLPFANVSYGGNYGRTKITTGGGYFIETSMAGVTGSGTSYVLYGTVAGGITTGVSAGYGTDLCTQTKYLNGLFVYLRDGASFTNTTAALTTSPTGATWTGRTLPIATWLYDVTYGNSIYVAVGVSGHIFTSSDAATWTQRTSGTSEQLVSVEWDSSLSLFICVGVTTIRTSSDGITWSTATIPSGLGTRSSNIPIAGTCTLLAKLNGTWFTTIGSSDHIISSTNGTTWTARFVGGTLSTSGTVIAGSTSVQTNNALFKLNTMMIACPSAGGIMTAPLSTNTWTLQSDTSVGIFNAVAYGAGLYVAVGNSGIIYTSSDGITWTSRTSGTATNLVGIDWSGSEFVAISSTAVLRSTNGTSWTNIGSNGGTSICYSGGQFIVFNGSTIVRLSLTGVTWIDNTISTSTNMRAFSNGAVIYGSTSGTAFIVTNSGVRTYIQSSPTSQVNNVTEINTNLYIVADVGASYAILTTPKYNFSSTAAIVNASANGLPGTSVSSITFGGGSGFKIGTNTFAIPVTNSSDRIGCIYGMSTFSLEYCRLLYIASSAFYNDANIWVSSTSGLAWGPKTMACSLNPPVSVYTTITNSTSASAAAVSMIGYRKIT